MPIRRRYLSHGLPISTAHRFKWHTCRMPCTNPGWLFIVMSNICLPVLVEKNNFHCQLVRYGFVLDGYAVTAGK
jgi:hypothetical protein